jgi:hypothetical protein
MRPMLATVLDLVAAYLIARNLRRWRIWLLVSLVVGAAIAVTYSLGLGALEVIAPGQAFVEAIAGAPRHAIFCALCTWGFRSFIGKP